MSGLRARVNHSRINVDISDCIMACRSALVCCLHVAGPLLCIALVSGLIGSSLQALLRVQDSTPTLVIRLLTTGTAVVLSLPWWLESLRDFAIESWSNFPHR